MRADYKSASRPALQYPAGVSSTAPAAPAHLERSLRELGERLLTPALIIDLDAVDHNIARLMDAVGGAGRWRPHIKTLKQRSLVSRLLEAGVTQFKCATLDELAVLLDAAGDRRVDILFAHPATAATLRRLPPLPSSVRLSVLADRPDHAAWLAERLEPGIDVMLDVDLGMHRTGSSAAAWRAGWPPLAPAVRERVSGLHGYDGHLRFDQRSEAHAGYDELEMLARDLGLADAERCTSGSHSWGHAVSHPSFALARHTVSPGTLVLSDLRSAPAHEALGLRFAAYVASRVISAPGPGRITLDAGSKAISPDTGVPSCTLLGWPDARPQAASEEHLPVLVGSTAPAPGAVCLLLPTHVCTTVNLHNAAVLLRDAAAPVLCAIQARGRPTPLVEAQV